VNNNKEKEPLTQRQQQVFDFIVTTLTDNGFPPTLQEICRHFSFESTRTAYDCLKILDKKGYIRKGNGKSRGLTILHTDTQQKISEISSSETIPFIDSSTASQRPVYFDSLFLGKNDNIVAAHCSDNGLKSEGIHEGDIVFIIPCIPVIGDIVLAEVEDIILVRRYYSTEKYNELQATEKGFPKIKFFSGDDDVRIIGKVIGVFHSF